MPPPGPSRARDQPWYTDLNIDLFMRVLNNSVFHPFVASLIPLCLRAAEVPYNSDAFKYSVYYAIGICIISILGPINERIAYGAPRKVDLENEIIVITGGASGLGRCLAEIYALMGNEVCIIDYAEKKDYDLGENVYYYEVDVSDAAALERCWEEICSKVGTPTILINNAAIVHGKRLIDELTYEQVEKSYRVNTISHYHLTSLFLKPLLSHPTGGTIVTISSALGYLGASHLSAYCGTKAALIAYHVSLTSELQSTNPMIKTILVTPGQLSTELFGSLDQGPIRRFFGPTVEVQTLAMKIKTMVNSGMGGHIAEPGYARWISILDMLPVGVQRVIGRLAGLDTAMAGFKVKTA